MIPSLRKLAAAVAFSAASAQAAPLSPDPTGYWFNPEESGWGASIAQQGDVVFVSLLVYDEQQRPEWLVATSVTDSGGGVFSGALYRTSGPWFGGAFNPALVGFQAVGTITLQYTGDASVQASLRLKYTVNGAAITRDVVRMTWASDAQRLAGSYYGGVSLVLAPFPQPSGCGPAPTFFPPGGTLAVNMTAPSTIAISHGEGVDLVNVISGTYIQSGQFGVITGSVFGGSIGGIRLGDAQVTNLVSTSDGFNGHLRVTIQNCIYEGSIGGIRR